MPGKKLNKKELAYAKVMTDLGHTPTSVGKTLGRSHKTIISHLKGGCDDPEVERIVALIKESELSQLQIIGFKSRIILNNYLDAILLGEKEVNPIAVCAISDRSFGWRRLIEGNSTENINLQTEIGKIKELLSTGERQIQNDLKLLGTACQDTQVEEDNNENDS